jgi:pimeloyl-ACP methyl ester carboxylesterase
MSTRSDTLVSSTNQSLKQIYNKKLTQWPVPYNEQYIDTSYGKTYLVSCGPPQAPALVLLPGLAVTSMMWLPNIETFAQQFRCYLIDVIGDYGRSLLNDRSRYPGSGKAYSDWLGQVFAGLGIEKADLIGASNGGFIAINHALSAPDQVRKLILLSPSGLELTLKKVLPKIFYYLLLPTDKKRTALINWFLGDHQESRNAFFDQMWFAMEQVPKVPIPLLVSSRKLSKLSMPVLVMVGENDPALSAKKVVKRITKHVPQAKTEIVPKVGHVINYEAKILVEDQIVDFLMN